MALPASMRFRDPRAIRFLLRRGRRMQSPLGDVAYAEESSGIGHILFIVPNRSAKKSTDRHRVKRRLDAWALKNRARIANRDIVVTIRRDAAEDKRGLLGRAEQLLVQCKQMNTARRMSNR